MTEARSKQPRPDAPPDAISRGPHAHIVPLRTLVAVFVTLGVLTILTVAATRVDLGAGNLLLALGIATVKATIVALWFMHLRWDRPFLWVVFLSGLFMAAIFIGITLIDTLAYRPDLLPGYAPAIEQGPVTTQ